MTPVRRIDQVRVPAWPGPVALAGGGEHLPASVAIDRWLLEVCGAARPRVVVVPSASPSVSLAATAAMARTAWHRHGAAARVVVPGRHPEGLVLDAIAGADVLVLTGGVPERLFGALGASPAGEAILDRWRGGAALTGSSAGAMVLFAWRLRIASARPLTLTPGLGALDGHVAVPHFDRFVGGSAAGRRFAERHRRRLRGLGVLGLDESTALAVHEGGTQVVGPGAVTLGDEGGWRRYRHGEQLEVELGLVAHRRRPDEPARLAL